MDQADHLQRIEEGRLATVAEALIIETIAEQEDKIIKRLRTAYRQRIMDLNLYYGFIGELVALEDLTLGLEYTQRQGEISAQKEFK